jgi:hypothetical protein
VVEGRTPAVVRPSTSRDDGPVIFGEHVTTPPTAEAAEWVDGARRGVFGTVGGLLPNDFTSFVRLFPPDPALDDWWAAYRDLFAVVADVGARHTTTPDDAWFAVWEGYGFGGGTRMYVWQDPTDAEQGRWLESERDRLREEDARRNAETRAALDRVPLVHLTHRSYHLVAGAVSAMVRMTEPGSPELWMRPDLAWPQDRSWFVATDVDFWSLYVGGDDGFVEDLVDSVSTPSEPVDLDSPLEEED